MTKVLSSYSTEIKRNVEDKPQVHDYSWAYLPVQLVLAPFGLTKYIYKNGVAERPGWILRIYGLGMMVVAAYIGVQQVMSCVSKELSSRPVISYVIDVLVVASAMLTAVANVGYSAFGSRKFCRMVNNFTDLDKRLEINKNRFYTAVRIKCTVIILLVTITLLGYYFYETSLNIELDDRLALHLSHLLDAFTNFQMFDFILTLWLHVKRFQALNVLLSRFLSEVPDPYDQQIENAQQFTKDFKNLSVFSVQQTHKSFAVKDKEYKEERCNRLLELMRIFDKLADNVYIVNCNYGVSLLFASISAFLYILKTMNGLILFNSLYAFEIDYNRFVVILWCMPLLLMILLGTYIAEELKTQVEDLSVTIDKLSILPTIDDDQQELLVCFTQMLTGRNVFITANNFFKFDFSFLFSLIGAIATYTVILMQVNYTPTAATNTTSTASPVNFTNTTGN